MTSDKYADKLRREIFAHMQYSKNVSAQFIAERVNKLVDMIVDYYEHYKETWLESPHSNPQDCPTYYDGCNCTVDTLKYNIERAEIAEDKLSKIRDIIK